MRENSKPGWQNHIIRRLNGSSRQIEVPADFQVINDHWKPGTCDMPDIGYQPNLVYMPEKDRLLLTMECAHPKPNTVIVFSDDHGVTWSKRRWMHTDETGTPDARGSGLTYLGNGQLIVSIEETSKSPRWFSKDYGESWLPLPVHPCSSDGKPVYVWDPMLVDKDAAGNVIRLVQTGWKRTGIEWGSTDGAYSQACFFFSTDLAHTWTEVRVPQWLGINEVPLVRAKNGDIIAACRTDSPKKYAPLKFDHYSGLGVSISSDNGQTWSDLNMLYEWGRHNASMVVLPGGEIVMSYVVRLGYTDTSDGFHRFGIEAVVSHDHGKTWDLDHRYLLKTWTAIVKDNLECNVCQSTSSVLLPGGEILTAFGTGFRNNDPKIYTMEAGLVKWQIADQPTNTDHHITEAPFDSDLRNIFDPGLTEGQPQEKS
jgi:hypothetical protein